MGTILEAVKIFLEEDKWPYNQLNGKTVYRTAFEGDNGSITCYIQEREEQQQLVIYSLFPVRVPDALLPQIAEFTTRVNYGMVIGNFELDYTDGEVRYKTSVDTEDSEIQQAVIRHLIYANVLTMDRYFSGLMRVIYAGVSALDAITEIENKE